MRRAGPRVVLGLHRARPTRELLTAALGCGVTAIDTAFNYDRFRSHRTLAGLGTDLLEQFQISTKVGFFPAPAGGQNAHSLEPAQLRRAVETSAADLGRRPEVVLLHNPERSLPADPGEAGGVLAAACGALAELAELGWCRGWGISCWDPRPLLAPLDHAPVAPPVLMRRAGLLVPADVLHTGEQLAARWDVPESGRWGMSPFAGDTASPLWDSVAVRAFLDPDAPPCSTTAAAFAVATQLPVSSAIAVGTSSPAHLRELADAAALPVNNAQVARYRGLLDQRARDRAAATAGR